MPALPAGAAHGGGDRAGRCRPEWRPARQEHLPAGTRRSSPPEIGGDSPSHVGRKRQPVRATALAAHHQLSRPPVDVVEPERSDLRTPQSQAHEQDDDRVVPAAKRAAGDRSWSRWPGSRTSRARGKRRLPALHGREPPARGPPRQGPRGTTSRGRPAARRRSSAQWRAPPRLTPSAPPVTPRLRLSPAARRPGGRRESFPAEPGSRRQYRPDQPSRSRTCPLPPA